jgi:hypothetical protein
MSRVLRIALMWLIAFAVPLQGFAATSMLFCGPVHEAAMEDGHSGHDHATHGHSHDDSGAIPDTHSGDADGQSTDKSPMTKCSVCASCCSGAAMPAEVATYTPPRGHAVFHALDTSATITFLTGRLDRPPQVLLA